MIRAAEHRFQGDLLIHITRMVAQVNWHIKPCCPHGYRSRRLPGRLVLRLRSNNIPQLVVLVQYTLREVRSPPESRPTTVQYTARTPCKAAELAFDLF